MKTSKASGMSRHASAQGASHVGKAVDDPVEIGQDRPVLGEDLRRRNLSTAGSSGPV
jgi:hypothetical protein